jgi:hypothetical protein
LTFFASAILTDPDDKAALLQMAEYWKRLAEEAEKTVGEKSQK